jgi:hypothetical protein
MSSNEKIDWDKVDEVALSVLSLTLGGDGRAWKGMDWEVMNRLHEKGWILDPKNKAKSVIFTEAGEAKANEVFREHFVNREDSEK